ncbi:MAG: PQQ-binding-like beta-propeller repeat protein, partial [Planctomycetia bacterium]
MRAVIAILVVSCLSTSAWAQWPEFRGPGAMGHADVKGLPLRWGDAENVAWKTPLAGLGWSSPVVEKGRVYLTTATDTADDGKSLRLVCLDAANGAVLFEKELFTQSGPVSIHPKNSHASPTPLVVGDRLVVHFGPHGTACTTLAGDLVWKRTLEYAPQHGNGGSPAVAGDVLVICCDGSDRQFVVGLDVASGEVRWQTDRDTKPTRGFSFATPLVTTVDGVAQAICPGSDAVFAYEPATGRE